MCMCVGGGGGGGVYVGKELLYLLGGEEHMVFMHGVCVHVWSVCVYVCRWWMCVGCVCVCVFVAFSGYKSYLHSLLCILTLLSSL